jgi:hypothetical protein
MALGSNRDYYSWHNIIVKRMKDRGLINLWECPKCHRRNLHKYENCPRCNSPKPEEV